MNCVTWHTQRVWPVCFLLYVVFIVTRKDQVVYLVEWGCLAPTTAPQPNGESWTTFQLCASFGPLTAEWSSVQEGSNKHAVNKKQSCCINKDNVLCCTWSTYCRNKIHIIVLSYGNKRSAESVLWMQPDSTYVTSLGQMWEADNHSAAWEKNSPFLWNHKVHCRI